MTPDPPLDPSVLRALAAGIGMAPVAGVLGCFVVWRRMAYFGDALAHTALLGIALGLLGGFSTNLGTLIVCTAFALLLVWLQQKRMLATDTLLGIFAHVGLAVGMVVLSVLEQPEFDLHHYLFGDILTVHPTELYWIYGGGAAVLALLFANWSSLALMTVHEDLAQAEGVKTFYMQLLLMFLMTVVVAVSIRIVGILLITSLLIIPAATARQLARSPEVMTVFAALLGAIAVAVGIFCSARFDTPSGPSIVTVTALLFAVLSLASLLARRGRG